MSALWDPSEAQAVHDAKSGMGSRLQVPSQVGSGWEARWSGQCRPTSGAVASCPASQDREKLPATSAIFRHTAHPGLSREGAAADGQDGQIPEGLGGSGRVWETWRGGRARATHQPQRAAVPGAFLYGALWGTQGLCGVLWGPSLWAKSIPLPPQRT